MTTLLFGTRHAEAYCVANDLEQAEGRVFEMVRRIVEVSPLLKREAEVTAGRIAFPATGATITAIASDFASAAGGHPTISCFDELWGYVSRALTPAVGRNNSCADKNHQLPADRHPRWF